MVDIFNEVAKFNKDAGTELSREKLPLAEFQNEMKMIQEEIAEFDEAFHRGDRVEMADALGDTIVVLMGTMSKLGFDYQRVMEAIVKSNNSKRNEKGTLEKNEDGKIIKGKNFKKPDLSFTEKPAEYVFKVVGTVADSKKVNKTEKVVDTSSN